MRCAAFPEGIPLLIQQGDFDHRQEFPGDNGIRWAPKHAKSRVWVDPYIRDGRPIDGYWKEIEDTRSDAFDTQTWWHVTPSDRVASVQERGLLPQSENEVAPVTRSGIMQDAVYLWPSRQDAENHIGYAKMRGWGDDFSILRARFVEPRNLAPDPEVMADSMIRWYEINKHSPEWRPNPKMQYGDVEKHLYDALDKVGFYEDAVGGPQWKTFRQWLDERDTSKLTWMASTPSDTAPEWFDEKNPSKATVGLIADMPVFLRMGLAEWVSATPGRMNSVVHLGRIPSDLIDIPKTKGIKGRVWVKPYVRFDGSRVEGHWRDSQGMPKAGAPLPDAPLQEFAVWATKSLTANGGFSLTADLTPGESGGFICALPDYEHVVPLSNVTPQTIMDYAHKYRDELSGPGMIMGGWNNEQDGKVYFDVSKRFETFEEAEQFGLAGNQLAIYDAFNGETVYLTKSDDTQKKSLTQQQLAAKHQKMYGNMAQCEALKK